MAVFESLVTIITAGPQTRRVLCGIRQQHHKVESHCNEKENHLQAALYFSWELIQSQPFRSHRNRSKAVFIVQHPSAMMTFRLHPNSPLVPCADIREATLPALTLGATRAGRLRATLPTTPVPLAANRHTVRAQESAAMDTQRVRITKVSSDSQPESIRRSAEPIRSKWAVQRSSLSHKRLKADKDGPSISPAHSRSLWS